MGHTKLVGDRPQKPQVIRDIALHAAPRGPKDSEGPDLLRFIVMPGATRKRRKKRKAMGWSGDQDRLKRRLTIRGYFTAVLPLLRIRRLFITALPLAQPL